MHVRNIAEWVAASVDPDQTPRSAETQETTETAASNLILGLLSLHWQWKAYYELGFTTNGIISIFPSLTFHS